METLKNEGNKHKEEWEEEVEEKGEENGKEEEEEESDNTKVTPGTSTIMYITGEIDIPTNFEKNRWTQTLICITNVHTRDKYL